MWKKCSMPQADTAERLQKVLAAAGVGSRRACEDLIFKRRVTVNGKVAKLGDKVDPTTAEILVDGQRVIANTKLVYLALNKPRGVVSSLDDEKGRTELADFVGQFDVRLHHVGRLDADSEGLLLITNDGELTNKLTHPRYEIQKTYMAEVINGPLPRNVGRQLLAGVELEDGPAKADSFKLLGALGKTAQVEIVLHEGRKHIVRRMMEEVGHPVTRLIRTAVGPVRLGDLRPGGFRHLSSAEVAALYKTAGD
ncbi:rRNA pseudouridine synthase [Actinoplanes sp. LDG1-06]|uniref:Pseudouridine synthase n=1 Tax=Paractinoplanes ovalisporus TaxID=2810368 RepID=A0ABS2AKR3_9ACTN|nr:pseudouridine synthase [Actinoplanes ovalisporus]MBM2620428.1 rRNA pseudouridine synthase [Actinoplanes ovalisporus]